MADARQELVELKRNAEVSSQELEAIVEHIIGSNEALFPNYRLKKGDEVLVHHFNAADLPPLTLERKAPGASVMREFAARVFQVLDDVLTYVENQK